MTKKKFSKPKSRDFVCSYCESEYTGIPYAVIELNNGLKKITCNAGCYKQFLKDENALLSAEIEDEVLMTEEAIAFQALLEKRADYAEILQVLKETLNGYREELQDAIERNKNS